MTAVSKLETLRSSSWKSEAMDDDDDDDDDEDEDDESESPIEESSSGVLSLDDVVCSVDTAIDNIVVKCRSSTSATPSHTAPILFSSKKRLERQWTWANNFLRSTGGMAFHWEARWYSFPTTLGDENGSARTRVILACDFSTAVS